MASGTNVERWVTESDLTVPVEGPLASRDAVQEFAIDHDPWLPDQPSTISEHKEGPQLRGPALTSCACIGCTARAPRQDSELFTSAATNSAATGWPAPAKPRPYTPARYSPRTTNSSILKSLLSYWWLHWIIRSKSTRHLWANPSWRQLAPFRQS
jgi:hypothetical protein